jgi:hypothetical protein
VNDVLRLPIGQFQRFCEALVDGEKLALPVYIRALAEFEDHPRRSQGRNSAFSSQFM